MIPRSGASYLVFGPEKYGASLGTNQAPQSNSSNNASNNSSAISKPPAEIAIEACGKLLGKCQTLLTNVMDSAGLRQKENCVIELSTLEPKNEPEAGRLSPQERSA